MREKRDEFHSPSGPFPLVNEPLIEAIPQYETGGEEDKPANLHASVSNELDKIRLERLSDYLEIAGDDWPLYPHQKESLLGYMEGKDVVIATGTGSGKTESFLFPLFSHLDAEAIRCKQDEEVSQRALKAIILYPMNALVADQMKRIRKYLGNPEISAKYMNNGYGRFPQFGMYTGRTDYHGWYERNGDERKKTKTENRMKDMVGNYADLKSRSDAWQALQELGKIPAIGGKVRLDPEGYLKYDQLSTKAKRDAYEIIDPTTGKKLNKSALEKRYVLEPREETFDRFNYQDLNPVPAAAKVPGGHIRWMGDKLDRELVVRHQMHQGGLRQYLEQNGIHQEYADEILNQTGVPDVLVTNYSMLEYMLMRPIEHVFWHETGNWLRNCQREDDDKLRRKLLLVVDEAHLYQGAMGTEFSLLLNRILSVLGDDIQRDQIQFIITSASLGEKKENKVHYAKGLLSIESERAGKMAIPESKIINIEGLNEQKFFNQSELGYFLDAWDKIESGKKRHEAELELLISLIGKKTETMFEKYREDFGDKSAYESTCYDSIRSAWWAKRLMRLLLQPKQLSDQDKRLIFDYYDRDDSLRNELEKPLDRIPRRFSLIQEFMFEKDSEETAKATEILLDVIASARSHKLKNDEVKPGNPLLPIRAHLFVRGNTVNRICCKCGTIHGDGDYTCNVEGCKSRTYTLYFDRNCGGVYLQLWLEGSINSFRHSWASGTKIPYPNPLNFGDAKRAHQEREVTLGRQSSDRLLGVLARVLDDDDNATHWLDPHSGFLSKEKKEGTIPIRMSRFRGGSFNFNNPETNNLWHARKWEAERGCIEPRICLYCDGDYTGNSRTSQFSDTETRGDEYFCGIITEAISIQDADLESKTPHKGKKMLVFSDGRQRAARLASKLSDSIAIDEGRALFVYLHRRPWFKELPTTSRNLDRIYPYMCLLSGSFGLNYLTDSENRPEKTQMLIHTITLSSWILQNAEVFRNENLMRLKSKLFDGLNEEEVASREMLAQIKNAFKNAISDSMPKDDDQDHESDEKKLKEKWLKDYKSDRLEVQDANGFDAFEDLRKTNEYKLFLRKRDRRRLKTLSGNRALCTCLGMRTILLENTEYGHIEISKMVAKSVISDMERDKLDPKLLDEKIGIWLDDILPYDRARRGVPDQFGSLIIRWITDNKFGLQELGLGSFKLIVDEEDEEKLSSDSLAILEDTIPQILRGHGPVTGSFSTKKTSSEGMIQSSKEEWAFNWKTRKKAFDYDIPMQPMVGRKEDLPEDIVEWIELKFGDELAEKVEDVVYSSYQKYFKINEPNEKLGNQMTWSLKAEKLIFIPWEGDIKSNLIACACSLPKYNRELKCLNCGKLEYKDLKDPEFKDYFIERLQHWRERIVKMENADHSDSQSSELKIFRAEEHTAQIGQKKDSDTLFSGTELHELMFQDIPLKGASQGLDTKIEQPPIDILSCTTTMEVGIDIGNLTAVALRTVPPHSANYQQRVGRAGRGKSEVSLALTWVDNSAYAQAHFEVPERLVKHPNEAPNLYLNNPKIRKRHFNAVCFQRYFKRKDYSVETLTFEDMAVSGKGNLLESLGTSEAFFSGVNPSYCSASMIGWLNGISSDTEEKIRLSSRTSGEEYRAWKEELIAWLESQQKGIGGENNG